MLISGVGAGGGMVVGVRVVGGGCWVGVVGSKWSGWWVVGGGGGGGGGG